MLTSAIPFLFLGYGVNARTNRSQQPWKDMSVDFEQKKTGSLFEPKIHLHFYIRMRHIFHLVLSIEHNNLSAWKPIRSLKTQLVHDLLLTTTPLGNSNVIPQHFSLNIVVRQRQHLGTQHYSRQPLHSVRHHCVRLRSDLPSLVLPRVPRTKYWC